MQPGVIIEEFAIPESLEGPGGEAFRALVDILNIVDREVMGEAAGHATPEEVLVSLADQQYSRQQVFVARQEEVAVALAFLSWSAEPDTKVTWMDVRVHPAWRNRGIGTALFDHLESLARASGRPILQGQATHAPVAEGPRLESPTGFGTLPRDEAGVRFLLRRGYGLEQVYRVSILRLPIDDATLAGHLEAAQARAGADYRIQIWSGRTPERWLDDVALIMNRMSTDAPSGNFEIEEEPWDAARVRHYDDLREQTGRVRLGAAVEHIPSGGLVAFNGLSVPVDRAQPVHQGVTLVLKEHRGHRLGMITKIANIQQLQAFSPQSPSIITDNAEENRPMLDVNEAVGFVPLAYVGAWKKTFA